MHLTKRWSEPPPDVQFTFQMIKTVSIEAARGLGGGSQLVLVR
jgi:hypothetical protein